MLEKLDTIDWSRLSHAFGEASDVPDLIKALAYEDKEERSSAIAELYGTIWHQGTVYEATAYAVPFLLELLEADEISDKDEILALLSVIAEGSSYLDVHEGMDPYSIERNREGFSDKLRQELGFVQRARDAVFAGIPVYLSLLSNASAETRMWSLYTLATCTRQAVMIETSLWERFAVEKEPQVKASMMLCLRDLRPYPKRLPSSPGPPDEIWLHRLLEVMRSPQESALVRFCSALSLIGWLDKEAREEVFARIEEFAGASWDAFSSLPWVTVDSEPLGTMTASFACFAELLQRFQLGLLQNPNPEIRTAAIYGLCELHREYRSPSFHVAAVIGELLSDPDSEVRLSAAHALGELGSAAQLATEKLLAALNDQNIRVCGYAVYALANAGEKRAVPRIRELLKNAKTAPMALNTLRKLGPLAYEAIDDLRALLHRPVPDQDTVTILHTLGEIDREAKSLADVIALLRSPVADTAAWVLSKWGVVAQPAITELLPLLNSPDELTRCNAVKALGSIGAPAAGITPSLVPMLKAEAPVLRANTAIALWQIERSPLTIPALIELIEQALANQIYYLQYACSLAAEHLGDIGAQASIASPVLLQALKHSSVYVRIHAACSLWKITGNTEDTLPVLIEELKHFRETKAIMDCLAAMGPLAISAVPKLQRIVESETRVREIGNSANGIDQDEELREMARKTLKAILQQ